MLQVTTPDLTTWDTLLPEPARRLPDELARIDAYLDDERFIAPWRALFDQRLGRPSVPVPTVVRLLYLKHRYQLGYQTLLMSWDRHQNGRRLIRKIESAGDHIAIGGNDQPDEFVAFTLP